MLTRRVANVSNQLERLAIINITVNNHHWEDKCGERVARVTTIGHPKRRKPSLLKQQFHAGAQVLVALNEQNERRIFPLRVHAHTSSKEGIYVIRLRTLAPSPDAELLSAWNYFISAM